MNPHVKIQFEINSQRANAKILAGDHGDQEQLTASKVNQKN